MTTHHVVFAPPEVVQRGWPLVSAAMTTLSAEFDQQAVNLIRGFAMDGPLTANSGHQGTSNGTLTARPRAVQPCAEV